MSDHAIWPNPERLTSRCVLQALRDALARLGMAPRGLLRRHAMPRDALGPAGPSLSDQALIAAMAKHPALIERPVVFGPRCAVPCRPREIFLDLPEGRWRRTC